MTLAALTLSDAQVNTWLAAIWLPFVRISGALMAAPLFSSNHLPAQFRVLLALFIAILLAPVVVAQQGAALPQYNPLGMEGVLLALNELLIGICMGFLIQLVFEAVMFAGQLISLGMGLGFATLMDQQQGISVPVLGQFLMLVTMLLFLALNGHLEFIRVIAGSFKAWPVGTSVIGPDALGVVMTWVSDMLRGAMRIALPAVIALLVVQVAMGVVSRAAPTLNLFAVGFPLTMLVGFVVVERVLPTLTPALEYLLSAAFDAAARFLEVGHVR